MDILVIKTGASTFYWKGDDKTLAGSVVPVSDLPSAGVEFYTPLVSSDSGDSYIPSTVVYMDDVSANLAAVSRIRHLLTKNGQSAINFIPTSAPVLPTA